jgi:hypothetical protein
MLYAELHGKLDLNAPDLEKREDILTSTVFGTLLVSGDVDVLVAWLSSAKRLGTGRRLLLHVPLLDVRVNELEYWFWPSLSEGQPDIMFRIGSDLLVVEAKFGSTKSQHKRYTSDVEGETESAPDQLLRQWRSLQLNAPRFKWYPPDIRLAIETTRHHLIYLVSARREASALRELIESRDKIQQEAGHDVPMWLLTWQDLYKVLVDRNIGPRRSRWIRELATLLERRHLSAFLGFPLMLAHFDQLRLKQFQKQLAVIEHWFAQPEKVKTKYFDDIERLDLNAIRQVANRKIYGARNDRAQRRRFCQRD